MRATGRSLSRPVAARAGRRRARATPASVAVRWSDSASGRAGSCTDRRSARQAGDQAPKAPGDSTPDRGGSPFSRGREGRQARRGPGRPQRKGGRRRGGCCSTLKDPPLQKSGTDAREEGVESVRLQSCRPLFALAQRGRTANPPLTVGPESTSRAWEDRGASDWGPSRARNESRRGCRGDWRGAGGPKSL